MNKKCYCLIYSRTHGELKVVSELTRGCRARSGQRAGAGARLWVTLRRAVWLLGLACSSPALAEGIVADSRVAPAQRPEVIATQNGLPQVNINAPNQAGISHNQYQQFDVGQKGAILNNSAVMTQTQLAGYIQGNGKLAPNAAPARVILNEVNSNNPSQLRGYMEVAGGKAQVIVANPSGIICDGCGTINAGRMTLTTGKPQLNADGSLAGYQVERGLIHVTGGGLNGDARHDTDYVDLLARAVKVNAGIWAKEKITVVAGRNQISADGETVNVLPAAGDAPELAIDMGELGGMYSGAIRMIGTEAGVGVRNQGGHLQAGKTLTVSSEGKLLWQATSTGPYTQAGDDITLTARDNIEHHGKLYSGGQLQVQSRQGEISQSGTLAAAGNVTLQAKQAIRSSGPLLAGSDAESQLIRAADLTLSSAGDIRASGSLLSQKKVSLSGKRVDIGQGSLAAEEAVIVASGDVALKQAQVESQRLTINSAGDIDSQQAKIKAGSWQITAESLFNQAGIWSQTAAGESFFHLSGSLDNTDGSIEANHLSFNSASLTNLRGRLTALGDSAAHWRVSGLLNNQSGTLGNNGDLQLDVGELANQQGTVQSASALTITARQSINNDGGNLLSGDSLTLQGAQLFNRDKGLIHSQQKLDIGLTGALDNQKGQVTGTDSKISAAGLNNQQGAIQTLSVLEAQIVGTLDNRSGTLFSQRDQHLQAGDLLNGDGGKISTPGALWLESRHLIDNVDGQLLAGERLQIDACRFRA